MNRNRVIVNLLPTRRSTRNHGVNTLLLCEKKGINPVMAASRARSKARASSTARRTSFLASVFNRNERKRRMR